MNKELKKRTIHKYRAYDTYELSGAASLVEVRHIMQNQVESVVNTRDLLLDHTSKASISFFELYKLIYREVINNKGGLYSNRVIFTGVGKNANLATKASETFASLGIPTMYLNSCHATHGDLGFVGPKDIVIHISMSGTTAETLNAARALNNLSEKRGSKVIQALLTGSTHKTDIFDIVIECTGIHEAHYNVKAPTSSTLVFLFVLDTLGVLISQTMGITQEDFHLLHPGGSLGELYRDDNKK